MKQCLRVTEIIGCKRQLWFSNHDEKRDLTHPIAAIGTELHNLIQHKIEDNSFIPDIKYPDNEERYDNFLNLLPLEGSIFKPEKRLYNKLDFEIPISGKPDLVIDDHILYDWKSGKQPRLEHIIQTNAYAEFLLKPMGFKIDRIKICYFGNAYPLTVTLKPNVHKQKAFLRAYNEALDVVKSAEILPPFCENIEKADFGCLFCEYQTVCKTHYYYEKEY